MKESPPLTHEIVTDTTSLCRLKTSDSQSKGFPQQQHDVVSVLEKKENRVRRDSSLQRYKLWSRSLLKMQRFAFFVAYVLLVEEKLEKKDQQKAKKYAKMEWKKYEGIDNRAVVDGVGRRDGFGLPVDDRLRSLDVSRFLSIFSSKANRRASIKSTFCVLVLAFVRFKEPLAIFKRSLMPRSLR